jgi:hypothetical protein
MDKPSSPESIDRIVPIDLSSLDPTRDAAAFEVRIGHIMHDAAASRVDVVTQLGAWLRPALVAAAVIAVAAAVPLARAIAGSTARRGATAAEILGIPAPVARLASVRTIGVVDLADAFSLEARHAR